ncbi:hypothetical protein FA95DRAFT_1567372 [Auriscalpium vulgare]|uniref:Uncharacterized protein n=1 Tax=Auriscalpium vulgare TaxID=40419 RepID=A0ACB8R4J9_9AGAM|nr:hypothetical protein FA95DRAFT_1567372 [Auriscalpium vulgare]
MSLDQNLFTLNVTPNEKDPAIIDLIDPQGTIHYSKQKEPGSVYKINVFDPTTQALLASATAPSAASKSKIVELHNPSQVVELKSIGTLSFKWSFKWEEHEFEWKREECYMIRKPDPAVLVAVTKEPPGRLRTAAVQILDYNLNRFDIDDRKGFEIVLLTALLTFHDLNDVFHTPSDPPPQYAAPTSPQSTQLPPSPPPKPAPKTGVDRIAELHALRGELNEVTVIEEGAVHDYAQYAAQLLDDEAMLFISIQAAAPTEVPKVLQVVEDVKRLRHKRGLNSGAELRQYVIYDTPAPNQPRRIVLDDPARAPREYRPPQSLTVHLSKIDMPELAPRSPRPRVPSTSRTTAARPSGPGPGHGGSWDSNHGRPTGSSREKSNTLKPPTPPRRPLSASFSHSARPDQHLQTPPLPPRARTPQGRPAPAPSPAQLNNPMLYVAPPSAPRPSPSSGGIWDRWRR